MIILDNDTLRKLQLTELELLVEVDRICRKNKIQYSLDGGTLLGAVRNGGFIPWDDDADVMMTRSEYNRFYEMCKNDLDHDKYFLQEFRTDPEYRWGYSKLRKNGTVFLREGQEHIKCNTGVCIDIFIFDKVPNNILLREIQWVSCFIIRKGLYSVVGRNVEKRNIASLIYMIMGHVPRSFWVGWLNRIINSEFVGNELMSHFTYPNRKSMRYGFTTDYYKEYEDCYFENQRFMVIKNYDKYLKDLFDDYMKLPPLDQRKIHPVSKIEL